MFLFNSMRDLHEHLTYFSKAEDNNAIGKIQLYLNYYLTYTKLVNALEQSEESPVFTLKIKLDVNGKTYTESSEDIVDAISQLDEAEGFDLDVRYYGKNGDISEKLGEGTLLYPDIVDNHYGMSEYLENLSDRNFGYRMMAYYDEQDAFVSKYIDENGCVNDYLEERGTVTEKGDGYSFCLTNNFSILAEFDSEKYSEQAESLKSVISEYVTDEENLNLLKELWNEGEIGIADLSEGCLNLEDFIEFTEAFNGVLSEIDNEDVKLRVNGTGYDIENFIAVKPFYDEEENKIRVWLAD